MFLIFPDTNFLLDSGSAAAARWRQRGGSRQHGSGVGSAVLVAAEQLQFGGGIVAAAAWRW